MHEKVMVSKGSFALHWHARCTVERMLMIPSNKTILNEEFFLQQFKKRTKRVGT